MHPEDPSILYFGTYRIWKSTDRGSNWIPISDDLTQGIENYFYSITTIAISKLDPAIVVAGTGDGKVQVSTNNGLTWEDVSDGLPGRWVTRVATDPFDDQTIYATVSGFRWDEPLPHVFRSENLGQTWTDITGNLPEFPVNDIVIDPDLPGKYIVGTDAGAYGTSDGGATWTWVWTGLPAVPVYMMKIHEPTRTIVVGTYGLSAYKASLDEIFTGIAPRGAREKLNLTVSPNPVSGSAVARFYLPAPENMTVRLYSLSGTPVKEIHAGTLQRGSQEVRFDAGTLAPGVYLVVAQGNRYSGASRIVIF
jgi:hypothetical protein